MKRKNFSFLPQNFNSSWLVRDGFKQRRDENKERIKEEERGKYYLCSCVHDHERHCIYQRETDFETLKGPSNEVYEQLKKFQGVRWKPRVDQVFPFSLLETLVTVQKQ